MIEIKNVYKTFQTDDGPVNALDDINLTIPDGSIFGIIGMSGAGKSTLVRCINMLERPTKGQVIIDGVDIGTLGQDALRKARRNITMIFQSFNLLMQSNVLDNVCFPLLLSGVKKRDAQERAMELLGIVGLPDKAKAYPAQLSGGQQQRVAIARALTTNPKVLLCDEATSALDPKTTHSILQLIRQINKELGITAVVITHQMSVVEEICHHVAILDHGHMVETGLVTEVFANPQSDAAKLLVYPSGSDSLPQAAPGQKLIRLVYNGAQQTSSPLISTMAIQTQVPASILSASTREIHGRTYGSMILSFPEQDTPTIKEFLSQVPDITVEEAGPNA